jgi:hypothetical protein
VADEDIAAAQREAEHAYYTKLGILPEYADERSEDASQLADLRIAEAKGRLEFAAAAKSASPTAALHSIDRRLRLIRTELTLSETLYQKWLDSTLTTTSVSYDEEIAIGYLPGPDEAVVKDWYDNQPDPLLQSFHTACKALGIAIAYEPSESDPGVTTRSAPSSGESTADAQVCYRVLRPGVLRVYAVTEDKDGKADELRLRSTSRVLVAAPGNEKMVPLLAGKADRSLTVAFDATGALTSISTDVTGSATSTASALGDLPTALQDAFGAGTELGKPFSAKGRAEALQAKADEKKARQDLYGVDPNQQLKEEVAEAELEARLNVAHQLASGGASTAVVVMGGTSG